MMHYTYYLSIRGVGGIQATSLFALVYLFCIYRVDRWLGNEHWVSPTVEYNFFLHAPEGTFFSSSFLGTIVMMLTERWGRQ